MSTRTTSTILIEGHQVVLSNTNKILYPETGFTKGDVVRYYMNISPALLPHLKNRALTMKRYPRFVSRRTMFASESRRRVISSSRCSR